MRITQETNHPDYERVLYCQDDENGLRAYIAVHSTHLGPAVGGCRMYNYPSQNDAREDVLRLARGMTYKNAAVDLPLGGGKAVIIGDPRRHKTAALMGAFGRFVDSLKGDYYTAEDVGTGVEDIEQIARETPYVAGTSRGRYASGDPSRHTARGVYLSITTALKAKCALDELSGITVAIQGLGHVGMNLAHLLHQQGVRLIVSDLDSAATREAQQRFQAEVVAPDEIHLAEAELFAPCAMGGCLTDEVIDALKVSVVCGAANNQLPGIGHAERLHQRGILYVPDYIVNSGGIINVASEILRITSETWVAEKIDAIASTVGRLLDEAIAEHESPVVIADRLVQRRLGQAV